MILAGTTTGTTNTRDSRLNAFDNKVSGGGQTTTSSTAAYDGKPQVVWFSSSNMPLPPGHEAQRRDDLKSLQEGFLYWYKMSDKQRADQARRMAFLGLIRDPNDFRDAETVWYQAVQRAAYFYAAGKKVSPFQVIDMMASGPDGLGLGNGRSGGVGAAPKEQNFTQTSRSVNLPTRLEIKGGVTAIFQSLVGRDPTKKELEHFTGMIHGYAKDHPTITTTKTHIDTKGNRTDSTSSKGGFTAQDLPTFTMEKEQNDPEYGAYQAATRYYNALVNSLAAPVQI